MNSDPMSDPNDAPQTPASESLAEGAMDVLDKKSAPRRKMPPPAHEPVSQADAVEADDGMDGELDGAVSYTHLDVYKRQKESRAAF